MPNLFEVGDSTLVRVGRVVWQADVEEASVLLRLERVHVAGGWADDEVL